MQFKDVEAHESTKAQLIKSIQQGRTSHAQLFHGPEGNGALPLAIAYAQYLSCENQGTDDSCGFCTPCKQFKSYNYPDLHFAYPVAKTERIKERHVKSSDYFQEWKNLLNEEKYFGVYRWLQELGIENKQAIISVHESEDILKQLKLKSYSGAYKFMILWLPERMNTAAANKLLKILEEPPQKTLFILISENTDQVLQTINSRCQKVLIPKYTEEQVSRYLRNHLGTADSSASVIAKLSDGNLGKAIFLSTRAESYQNYAELFSNWVRACFKADIKQILEWVDEISKMERERLKDYLSFCTSTFSDSFKMNFISNLVSAEVFRQIKFELEKFAPFVHMNNCPKILADLDQATYEIGRNGNPKVILLDMSLNMARQLRVSH